jgi:type I restriction enzyme M protein
MSLELQIDGNKIFAPLKGSWLKLSQEETVRQKLICKLVNHYGYDLEQMDQDVPIRKRYKADIAIWKSTDDKSRNKIPSIIIAVEVKGDNIKIKEEDYLIGYNVASIINANFFIASNLKEEKIFYVVKEPLPKRLEKLNDIPNASILTDNKKIEKYVSEIKVFTRDDFSKLLSRCHNIIRNNDKLSPEAAFDEISKILFMKIRYERNPDESNVFSLEVFKKQEAHYEKNERQTNIKLHGSKADIPYMDYWFELTKSEFAIDEIFDENDRIRIKQGSFESIVKELEKYNLSDTSDDIKGIAFEEFLGKTFRGELGQFFTPRTIVDYMVHILDPQEGETVCDPCCGSGGFLIKAFEYIRNNIELKIQEEKERIRQSFFSQEYYSLSDKKQSDIETKVTSLLNKLNSELELKNTLSRLRKLSYDCIFGIDANPRMARTAKMNMIMHGDGHGGVHHHDGFLNVNGIYDGKFDIILTNPPFGARVEKTLRVTSSDIPPQEKIDRYSAKYPDYESKVINQLRSWAAENDGKGKPILDLFDVGKMSGLTEVLFIERCLRLLKPGGRMGIVLPEGVLNNPILQKVREYVESKAKIINITSIPQDVFIASGATVKPSLLFLKKFTSEEEIEYNNVREEILTRVNLKYQDQIDEISSLFEERKAINKIQKGAVDLKEAQKEKKDKFKEIELLIENEIKQELKTKFTYKIPIIEVEKAGISTTGAKIENELVPVANEFAAYRKKEKIWETNTEQISYIIDSIGDIKRVISSNKPDIFIS